MVSERYLLEEQLGRGGMGTVWRAHDELLQRTVAVKEIELPHALEGKDRIALKARIMREARTAAALSHPNAVTVFDVIEEDGRAFIVMELVDSPSLSEILERRGTLSPEEAAGIGVGVLGALEAAHAAGIVHRDVKPSNVMVADSSVKLADFGIATVTGDPKITETGLILGSPSFMAPEQALSKESEPATDLWGLGVTLYTAVEGRAPFERGEAIPTLTAILHDEPAPMRKAGPLAAIIQKLLEKGPADRPGIPAVRRALEDVASGSTPATTVALGADSVPTEVDEPTYVDVHDEPEPTPMPTRREPARRSWGWVVAVAAIALAVAALLWLPGLLSGDEENPTKERRRERAAAPAQNDEPAEEDPAEEQPTTSEGAEGVPDGWEVYTDPATGYRIAHPQDWTPAQVDGTRTDFTAPNGDYLRVDYTTEPGSTQEDHIAAWEAQSDSFAADYGDYQELGIEGTDFRGWPGALWEYTYSGRHAYDLGFTASPDYGFALNFVTSEATWDDSQDEWEAFKASFQPPS